MPTRSRQLSVLVILYVFGTTTIHAQGASSANTVTQGAVLFRQECTYCHGVAARGGMQHVHHAEGDSQQGCAIGVVYVLHGASIARKRSQPRSDARWPGPDRRR